RWSFACGAARRWSGATAPGSARSAGSSSAAAKASARARISLGRGSEPPGQTRSSVGGATGLPGRAVSDPEGLTLRLTLEAVVLAYLAAQAVQLPDDERNAAVRRALFV